MSDNHPVYRLTQEAYDALDIIAQEAPEKYLDPNFDFAQALRERNVSDFLEETNITTKQPIALTPAKSGPPRAADIQALDFYRSFNGMTPSAANDERLWAWINHFRLHAYSLERWRRNKNVNLYNYIRTHWFTIKGSGRQIWQSWQSNTAARTWWLGHTAAKAARGAGGAFTEEEALALFADTATYYHTLLRYTFTRHPKVLGEIARAYITETQGMKAEEGSYALLGALNLMGGTQMLELLPQEALRARIEREADKVMSNPELVADPSKLRNRKPFRSLSLGAGVQSTALALMAERGEFGLPKPDIAIFADTGWEPQSVYDHLDWLEKQLSFPVIRVHAGNIKDHILAGTNPKNGRNYLGIPAHLVGVDGAKSVARRQCTANYKVFPINEKLRELLGAEPGKRVPKDKHVEIWMGISADEALRQKPSREEWSTNRFPLVELGFSRAQLLNWFQENYPDRYLPRSACIGCPYKSDAEWKWLKVNSPDEFEEAAFIDRALREVPIVRDGITKNGASAYLHRSRTPLADVDFDETQDYDDYMAEECEGLCGI